MNVSSPPNPPSRHNQCVTPEILRTTSSRCHLPPARGQAATNLVGELLAKFARPLPHGFVAHGDPAGGQQLLHHAETERKAAIQPHGMTDDFSVAAHSAATAVEAPIPAVASQGRSAPGGLRSFDDLVGAGEDRRRDRYPKLLGSLQIDAELVVRW